MSSTDQRVDHPSRSAAARRGRGEGPLAGVRIADFCWVGVGALATRTLADFGAEVIKIEDRRRMDLTRRMPIYKGAARPVGEEDTGEIDPDLSGHFNNYNRNKLSVNIDMRSEKGRDVARRLIANCGVVTENFSPGVMERWGLTYEAMRELNPSVIYARMSGFGHSGPDTAYRSYGPVVQAVGGLTFGAGLPGREPSGWGMSYMDNMAAYNGSIAVLMAIYRRNATGEGCEIDVSALEASVALLGPVLLDVSVNGRATRGMEGYPPGNLQLYSDAAPHGVYPAAGEDRWIAISVFDDDDWGALRAALGGPAWCDDPRFADQRSRRREHAALDAHLAAWTAQRDPREAMEHLQAHGVRAAAVQNSQEICEVDPQLAHRGTLIEMDHPKIGPARLEGLPFTAAETKPAHWRSAPLLAEDNEYVFSEIVGMSRAEIDVLTDEGVL
ncbi:L-carnitine dehydratase/bile acid-inducible protein F [Parafrankia sp. EAN1pec]|uniref:CoA transferase n=1 Tax=Parafrankia sp. (strain EAN1pec) TaxID=298653 RepID=UPI0000541BED|nr:L-carnitine dehydratase/bile acid-inducible protein F [Frankia sp. EAN1pec]